MATVPVAERFLAKTDRAPGGCWLWTAHIDSSGYGRFQLDGRNCIAHRVSYELFVGSIPEGQQIDHLCRVRRCVNPTHLEPVTSAENTRRGIKGVLTTHCPLGHPYEGENLYLHTDDKGTTRRMCRACNRRSVAEWRERTAA